MLGKAFCTLWGERCVGVSRSTKTSFASKAFIADIRDIKQLETIFDRVRPSICFHFAANTNLVDCETNPKQAFEVNCTATEHLAALCVRYHARMCYMSTDSVFDGRTGNYSENDTPNPINAYARTKLVGEQITLSHQPNNVVIRGNIIGTSPLEGKPSKFLDWIIDQFQTKQQFNGFTDVIFNPLSVNSMSKVIGELLEKDKDGGVWHVGSLDPISKYDFILKLAELKGFEKSLVKACGVETINMSPPRPKNTSLNIGKLLNFGLATSDVTAELNILLQKEINNGS